MPKIDWNHLPAVIAYARELGEGMTVFKHPSRRNFNITHTDRKDRYEPSWVQFQT